MTKILITICFWAILMGSSIGSEYTYEQGKLTISEVNEVLALIKENHDWPQNIICICVSSPTMVEVRLGTMLFPSDKTYSPRGAGKTVYLKKQNGKWIIINSIDWAS